MDAPAVATRRPAEQVLLPALERGLDSLAQQVRADVEPPQFFRDMLRLLVHTARADEAVAWMLNADGAWNRLALQVSSSDGAVTSQTGLPCIEWLTATLSASGPQLTRIIGDDGELQRIAGPIRQGGTPVGVLEAQFPAGALPAPANTLLPYCGALAELAGDFLVQHELRLLRRERTEWKQWDQWLATLQSADGPTRLAELISHDGRALTTSDRVTVLRVQRGRVRVASISGVDVIDPRSSTVQALERLAQSVVHEREDAWCGIGESVPAKAESFWQRLREAASTSAAGVLLLRRPDGIVDGVVICERFQNVADAAPWRGKCAALQRFTTSAWSAAVERSAGFLTRFWEQRLRALSPRERGIRRLVWTAAIAGGVAAALTLIPADLVITGEGRLLPAERRDIFATATGIVDSIRVQHGDTVQKGDTLLVLRDPALELETTRVTGELATARTRLNVVQAARISGTGGTGDATLRAQQLAGEEEELRQKQESLTHQLALLVAERKSWTLNSPIDGQVLTWDVEPLLAGRPVQRGHVLLEVGATAGEWVIDVRLRERDAGAVMSARGDGEHNVPVEFVPVTGKRWTAQGEIREVAKVTEVDERGDSSVRLTVAFDRSQVPELRAGKTVLPRISCGQHPLGYVWFRDVIDAVRRTWWQWW